MTFVDLEPAAQRMSALVRGTPSDQMDDPTPCAAYTTADLLDHIANLTVAFTDAARKTGAPTEGPPPEGDGAHLDPNWRAQLPPQLDALVQAWRDPEARTGMTRAGGIEMPGEVAAVVALEELVVHGWDLARATGQVYTPDDASLGVVIDFASQFAGPDQADLRGTAFAAPRPVASGAALLDRAIAMTGRDPNWICERANKE